MKKIRKKRYGYKEKWMNDPDLAKVIFFLLVAILGMYLVLLYILTKVDPQGYVLLFYPFAYIYNLYHQATPGDKLNFLYLIIGGFIGWFSNKLFSKKTKN